MKYLVIVGDGMADYRQESLGGATPLMKARTPNLDLLAKGGMTGLVRTVPPPFPPGSDIANLTILGYDPSQYYPGRAPLEATNLGIKLFPGDVAFRCNLCTLSLGKDPLRMVDFSASHISNDEARVLIEDLNRDLSDEVIRFFPGLSYRHIMVWKGGEKDLKDLDTTPPHDITGREVTTYLPKGKGAERLQDLMDRASRILQKNPINAKRVEKRENPANAIWLWGQGSCYEMPSFKERFGLEGSIISAVDLIKGIGISIGFKVVEVEGATGYFDTNYEGKAAALLLELKERDFVYLHVEAPDEASHEGSLELKIKAIEDLDRRILSPILQGAEALSPYKILVLPDHLTPLSLRTHVSDPVPFLIYSSDKKRKGLGAFNEENAKNSSLFIQEGHTFMNYFLEREG